MSALVFGAAPGDVGAYDPGFVARWAPRLGALVRGYFRAEVRGLDRLPAPPFLIVANHSGAALMPDTLVLIDAYLQSGRSEPLHLLAHDAMFDVYPERLARFLARFGAVRARPETGRAVLAAGHPLVVYPGGDHDACRSYRDRHRVVFAGRRGYVALARDAGVPIVPAVSCGAHEALFILSSGASLAERLPRRARLAAFPISLSVPWGLFVGPLPGYVPLPTKVELEILHPISPTDDDTTTDARVRTAMQTALDRMAAHRRFPVLG